VSQALPVLVWLVPLSGRGIYEGGKIRSRRPIAEALAARKSASFGIRVTIIEPGPIRDETS